MTKESDKSKNSKHFSPAFKLLLDFAEERGLLKEASKSNTTQESKMPKHVVGKSRGEPCLICDEDREPQEAHFPRRKRNGGAQTIPLCPTHHRLIDNGRISREEMEKVWKKRFTQVAATIEDFVEWAHQDGYPYGLEDLERKFWE